MTDDACLTPLYQCVQLPFVQHMDIIRHVGLIQKVSYQLPVCAENLVHHPGLPSILLVEQEIYDKLCKLMQNVYIIQKPVHAP